MIRKIVSIDEKKCNGCGACAAACHEGAIVMGDGKAKLIREDYCDGLGDCLPACPVDAIKIVEREAAAYDDAAVKAQQRELTRLEKPLPCGCPGTQAKKLDRLETSRGIPRDEPQSQLSQWPVQLKLVPVRAPYFDGAKLLIAADCTAYAYAGFHERFIKGRITLIGCPKLDGADYAEKLTAIMEQNEIQSVTIVRMEVPCCGGLASAAKVALQNSKGIPWQVVTVSTEGKIIREA